MTDRRPPCHGMTDLYFPDYKERPEATAERLELCRRGLVGPGAVAVFGLGCVPATCWPPGVC